MKLQTTLPQSALQTEKHADRTEKYRFISTEEVVNRAMSFGWNVVKAGEGKARIHGRQGFQKHIVIMEKPSLRTSEGNLQLVIRNSHDGTSAVQLFCGYMRIVCNNQLFAKNLGKGMSISIRHSNNGAIALEEFLSGFDRSAKTFSKSIKKMSEKVLDPRTVRVFAEEALRLRFEENQITEKLIADVLVPERSADNNDTAWAVMNRIQEKLVNGGLFIVNPNGKKTKMRKVRSLKGIDTLLSVNTKLMDMAMSL